MGRNECEELECEIGIPGHLLPPDILIHQSLDLLIFFVLFLSVRDDGF